ncbi:MAG: SMC family ATPase [Actinomycetes bacterium]
MKLHRLRLGALGPFADEHDIDLGRVSAGGLFLLEGPTGAGKSTILDAITFALYGGVAGRSTSKDRLHSDFNADADPFAELDFSIAGSSYRIKRSPAFDRAKRDGSGTTTVNARVWLWRMDIDSAGEASEELISNRVREADDEVRRLLGGLSLEQFCQVVVLPQGEFATFLRADAEQRRDVLQRLFATDHYQEMERIAAEQRQAAQRELALAQQHLRDGVVSLRQSCGDESSDELSFEVDEFVDLPNADRDARVAAIHSYVIAVRDAASRDDNQAQDTLTTMKAAHDVLVGAHDARRRRDELVVERTRLVELADDIAALMQERDRAMRVHALKPMFDERERIENQHAGAVASCTQYRASLAEAGAESIASAIDSAKILELSQRLSDELTLLGPAGVIEEALPGQLVELDALLKNHGVLTDEVRIYSDRLQQLPEQLTELVRDRDASRELNVRSPDLERRLGDAQQRLQAWEQLAALDKNIEESQAMLRDAVDLAQHARDQLQTATELRLSGMAAELAGRLTIGEACVVCGSTEHPQLAVATDSQVSQEQLDALTRNADDCAQRRRDRETVLASEIADRERCRALAGEVDPAQEIAALAEQAALAKEAQINLPILEAQCETYQRELDEARDGLTTGQANLASLQDRIATLEKQVSTNKWVIDSARAEHVSVQDRMQSLTEQIATATQWSRSAAEAESFEQHLMAVSEALDTAAREAGCVDADDALAGVRSDEQRALVAGRIADHERRVAINSSALAELDQSGSPETLADLDVSAQRLSEAARNADLARTRVTSAQITVTEVARCVAVVAEAQNSIAVVQTRTSPMIRVADALTGQGRVNPRRMTLSTYVLRERFASVVEAASRRLDRMSDGRYVLERDEAVAGNKKAGLGLLVLDQWTGARRDTRTLSGGESFYASLSLALGLADVVRDEAGGIELETLFIDEGFGSLDPESLESVLDVIDSLRDGGRVVGIVSHVSELKERIPDRIEIRRRPDGSSTVSIRAT